MDKVTFRSSALVYFGEPIVVDPPEMPTDDPAYRERVQELTDVIRDALSAVTIQAEHREAVRLVERAEDIFTADAEDDVPLEERFEIRQRLMEGYHALKLRFPEELSRLELRITRYERDLHRLGVDHEHIAAERVTGAFMARYVSRQLALLVLLAPFGLVGMLVHFPAYHLIDFLAWRLSRDEDDVVSTIKVLGGMLFFPLSLSLIHI